MRSQFFGGKAHVFQNRLGLNVSLIEITQRVTTIGRKHSNFTKKCAVKCGLFVNFTFSIINLLFFNTLGI